MGKSGAHSTIVQLRPEANKWQECHLWLGSRHARSISGRRSGPTVSVLLYDGMSAFELGIVTEVFGLPRPELDVDWYSLSVCQAGTAPVRMVGGASIVADHGLDVFAAADTVIVPGVADVHGEVPAAVVTALQSAHGRGARMVSICSGAFALAAAGLLDGRRTATHWRYAELLIRRFPEVLVDADVLYVDDGDVLTSAGSAAGLDLSLHLVRNDFGPAVANAVARRLVIPPHRDGGQAQFIESPIPAASDDDRIARSMEWVAGHLTAAVTVGGLARLAHMSERSYVRHFVRAAGVSPIRWVNERRVQASLELLETTDLPVETVAAAVGFDSPVTFRQHFGRSMGTPPSAYRRSFRVPVG